MRIGEWVGTEALDRAMQGLTNATTAGVDALAKAARARTPRDTGELQDSLTTSVSGTGLVGKVAYTADHAIPVHEDLDATFETGEAKFLERAVELDREQVIGAVLAEVRELFR